MTIAKMVSQCTNKTILTHTLANWKSNNFPEPYLANCSLGLNIFSIP